MTTSNKPHQIYPDHSTLLPLAIFFFFLLIIFLQVCKWCMKDTQPTSYHLSLFARRGSQPLHYGVCDEKPQFTPHSDFSTGCRGLVNIMVASQKLGQMGVDGLSDLSFTPSPKLQQIYKNPHNHRSNDLTEQKSGVKMADGALEHVR